MAKTFFGKCFGCCWPVIDATQDIALAAAKEVALQRIEQSNLSLSTKEQARRAAEASFAELDKGFDEAVIGIIRGLGGHIPLSGGEEPSVVPVIGQHSDIAPEVS